jgi:hypothetical protein
VAITKPTSVAPWAWLTVSGNKMGTTPATVAPSNAYARYQGSTHRRQEYSPSCAAASFDTGDAVGIHFEINGPMTTILDFFSGRLRMNLTFIFNELYSHLYIIL